MTLRPFAAAALLAVALPLAGCNRTPAPVPAVAPTESAPGNAATATLDGITLEARLVNTATLGAAMARQYGIAQADDRWLLLITLRDANGNAVPADAVKLEARAGGLTDAPAPVALKPITVNGLTDLVGSVQATAPATLRIEIDATRGGSTAQMRFSRDLPGS